MLYQSSRTHSHPLCILISSKSPLAKDYLLSSHLSGWPVQLCTEMERKAVSIKEQEAEYHRVQAAYNQMNAALELSRHEKRHSKARALDLEAQIRRDAKERE